MLTLPFRGGTPARGLLALIASAALAATSCAADRAPRRQLTQGEILYNQGKYAEALPLLLKTREAGPVTGTLLYQIGFCRQAAGGDREAKREVWKEAVPLLEKEIAAPGGATLERLYEVAIAKYELGDPEAMRKYGEMAVGQIEKGPDPNALTGEDWFRLARLHDFMHEASEAEAAYRRAASAFAKKSGDNPVYQALVLARVADLDRDGHYYDAAAAGYDQALKLVPGTDQVSPFHHGLALLAIGRLDDAIARFGQDRDPDTVTESQYLADLARKARDVGPLPAKDLDESPVQQLSPDDLVSRIKSAAQDLRAARERNSYKPGDPLPAEVAHHQKRFLMLLREQALRDEKIQEFSLRENVADLVRR